MRRTNTIQRNLCFLALILFVGACAPTGDVITTQPGNDGIQPGQSSTVNKDIVYNTEKSGEDFTIGEIDVAEVNFDVPAEVVEKHQNQWQDHQKQLASQKTNATDQDNANFFSKLGVTNLFPLFEKENQTDKRSTMAIAFQKAFTNGNMLPADMMKDKQTASPTWNQDLTLAIVFGGIAFVSLITGLTLLSVLPFPGDIIAFLIFLGVFITFAILGIIRLVEGLN